MIDIGAYAEMPWNKKVAFLLGVSGISTQDASRMLGAEQKSVDKLLGAEDLAFDRGTQLHERTDRLLSVLAYALRLAEYEAEKMPDILRVQNLFAQSLAPAPWDSAGLQGYLMQKGHKGIYNSLKWIREH